MRFDPKPVSIEALQETVASITRELTQTWWKHEAGGTAACVPHLEQAISVLAGLGSSLPGHPLLDVLRRRAAHPLPAVRRVALRGLALAGQCAADLPDLAPLLARAAKDRNAQVRRAALETVAGLDLVGGDRAVALAVLTRAVETETGDLRIVAAGGLLRASRGDEAALAAVGRLRQRCPALRYAFELAESSASPASAVTGDPLHGEASERQTWSEPEVLRLYRTLSDPEPGRRARAAKSLRDVSAAGMRIVRSAGRPQVVTVRKLAGCTERPTADL